jgi:hypothetical protein
MDAERAKAELEAKRTRGAVLERLGGLSALASTITGSGIPRDIRTFVEESFTESQHPRLYGMAQRVPDIGAMFVDLSDAQRDRLIETLLPAIAPSVKAGWTTLERRPFQQGGGRRPFRSPHAPKTIAAIRGRWLLGLTLRLGEYDADIRWIAEHAAYLAMWAGSQDMAWLLASAIDSGTPEGEAVFEILRNAASGDAEAGQMGRHVTQALMICKRPEGWEIVEKLLLAAQRQEGLRQSILESIDESHPHAFRRMLRLILDENLTRFSSVVRAADVWFGFMWDGASAVKIESILTRVLQYLDDADARTAALGGDDPESAYLALWSIAFDDVDAAIQPAITLTASPDAAFRFVATHFLAQTTWTSAIARLADMLDDPDLNVASRALDVFGRDATKTVDAEMLFVHLESLLARLPKRTTQLTAPVWPWWSRKLERSRVASAMVANGSSVDAGRLLGYVPELEPNERAAFVRRMAGLGSRFQKATTGRRTDFTASERRILIDLMGDAASDVRAAVFDAVRDLPVLPDETDRLIELLDRKAGDLRSGSLTRLRLLPDDALLAAADRLLADSSEQRRIAGLELLREARDAGRVVNEARGRVERLAADAPALAAESRAHVAAVLGERTDRATTDDALGLVDPSRLRQWPEARRTTVELDTRAAHETLESLAQLVLAHQQHEVRLASGDTRLLVESATWAFGPRRVAEGDKSPPLPLADVWRAWLANRPARMRDADGLELLRAIVSDRTSATWKSKAVQQLVGLGQYRAGERFISGLLEWCAAWEAPKNAMPFLLDVLEGRIAAFTNDDLEYLREQQRTGAASLYAVLQTAGQEKREQFRDRLVRAQSALRRVRWWASLFPESAKEHFERFYGLVRGFERRSLGLAGIRVTLEDFATAHSAGLVDQLELVDLLIGKLSSGSQLLREASTRKPPRAFAQHPDLLAVVDSCRRRIVEVETQRGDRESPASRLAIELRMTGGLDTLSRAMTALGMSHFARHFSWMNAAASRQETLSHLVLRSVPREEDTPDAFAGWAKREKVNQARLVELALYAPQWAAHVNHVLEWPGLESAVWWIQAHTKDDRSWQLNELKELWAAEVSERTPLSAVDLTEGGVDVAWFHTAYETLGAGRWKVLDTAAKYAASSAGHTRAQLFARAMSGLVAASDILARMGGSRHQDSVRALGLVPLAPGEEGQRHLLERYKALQEFHREARTFGSQRQASEKRAVAIGLANLARTAGFRDPQRLQWAMEQKAVADLARGPVVLQRDDVTFTLSIDADGAASLAITKNGKPQKTVPASLKKDAAVEELKDRLQELKRQRSRVRDALEEAMCRGDRFSAAELRTLFEHPILGASVAKLVFVGDDVAGYPDEGGRTLRDQAGARHVLGNEEEIRLAHPNDLFVRGDWSAWQRECFTAERVQPFKQLFRELYPLTESERGKMQTPRYAGHQVNPRQALALLGSRGWIVRPEEGVSRTFHDEGITVRLSFQETFMTPAEIEGLTLEDVIFTRKADWLALELSNVPPRVFSEAMRDLDLVVSVAHRGGVDPEATASTIDMRAALVRETTALLGLTNVEMLSNHAIITGTRATYSVHLGSANVMLMPGTAIPIVAVHSQHRGRMFLPFADDDPRSAEVLSKVLLLARDTEIRDPNILDWIRAATHGPPT